MIGGYEKDPFFLTRTALFFTVYYKIFVKNRYVSNRACEETSSVVDGNDLDIFKLNAIVLNTVFYIQK